jgi:methylmalonyl-CoA mutase N-terminal domain/subunit
MEKGGDYLIPYFIDCVKEYATVQEMCDILREVFGEAQPMRV